MDIGLKTTNQVLAINITTNYYYVSGFYHDSHNNWVAVIKHASTDARLTESDIQFEVIYC